MFESQFSVAAYQMATQSAARPDPERCGSCHTFHRSNPKYLDNACPNHPRNLARLPPKVRELWIQTFGVVGVMP